MCYGNSTFGGGIKLIEVKNVTKKYGSFVAVNNISFTVNDGEVVGFLGPNGAGKSTTMNMITGFIEPTEGTIVVNGNDIMKKTKKAKKDIGYMPENVPLYNDLTVKEFVSYMAELKLVKKAQRKEEVEKVLKQTGLVEVQNKLTKNLSRGYKQRTSLAGALVGNPEVLILDEPTVGLDPKQIIEIRNLIKELGKEHTVMVSSHILSEISQLCDRVIIINKGEIVAIDKPENLEDKTKEQNIVYVTVEDKEDKMSTIKEKIPEILEIKMIKDNEDGTKQYQVISDQENDIRKILFDVLPKEEITIFELKKAETSLEDAFIKLVDDATEEYNKKQAEKERKEKEEFEKELQEEEEEIKRKKEEKAKKKEERAKKKQEKAKEKQEKKENKKNEKEQSKEEGGKN